MWRCAECGNDNWVEERVDQVFDVDGRRVLVEGIPARICTRCGDVTFTGEVADRVRRLARGEETPARSIPMDVYAFP